MDFASAESQRRRSYHGGCLRDEEKNRKDVLPNPASQGSVGGLSARA